MIPEVGRILGVDIGEKRTGVSLSDERQILASPHSVLEVVAKKKWAAAVSALVTSLEVVGIVVGLPLDVHGEEGEDALGARKYIEALRHRTSIPIVEWDERFTTLQAQRVLLEADLSRKKRKSVIDKVAAAIILQSFLDARNYKVGENDAGFDFDNEE